MNIAILGCGFVADLYMATLAAHPGLRVVAACDRVPAHAERFRRHWNVPVYTDADALIAQVDFDLVLNLTNPAAHYEESRRFLLADKHVYSEKPLAMRFDDAERLVELAERRGLSIASAPCNHLGEAAQGIARALNEGRIGQPQLAYAEMDDGYVSLAPYRSWRSVSGAPWPYADEFSVGCTLEHVGYCLTWLLLFFGPVARVVSFQSLLHPGKPVLDKEAADYSTALLEFHSGVVARLTCSIVAPHDHRVRIVGDEGVLTAQDSWFYRTPVTYQRYLRVRNRFMLSPWRRRLRLAPTGPATPRIGAAAMDFARGPREMVLALQDGRRSRIPADFCLHANEVSLAIHHAAPDTPAYRTRTRFEPVAPVTGPIV